MLVTTMQVETYLNRPEVQVALHANITGLPYQWTHCRLTSLDSPTNGLTAGQIVVLRQQIAWALHVIMIALLIIILSPYIQFCSSSSSPYGLLRTMLINTLCLLLLCSDIVDYSNDDLFSSILPTYHTLINSGLEILVFR